MKGGEIMRSIENLFLSKEELNSIDETPAASSSTFTDEKKKTLESLQNLFLSKEELNIIESILSES
jgi:hypothetical protein